MLQPVETLSEVGDVRPDDGSDLSDPGALALGDALSSALESGTGLADGHIDAGVGQVDTDALATAPGADAATETTGQRGGLAVPNNEQADLGSADDEVDGVRARTPESIDRADRSSVARSSAASRRESRIDEVLDTTPTIRLDQAKEASLLSEINGDKANLFSLADRVLGEARGRDWSAMVVDATSGYYVAQFLGTAFKLDAPTGDEVPPVVHIANSRSVRDSPVHQRAVLNRLSRPDLQIKGRNVLVATEYMVDGHGVARLTAPLRALGASAVDAAVLNRDYSTHYATPPSDRPDNIYKGGPNIYEPRLFYGPLKTAVGQLCRIGTAEPIVNPDSDPQLHNFVSGMIDKLAVEYIRQRQ